MTYGEFKLYAVSRLGECPDVENPEFEALNIMCHFSALTRAELLSRRAESIDDDTLEKLNEALGRRLLCEPLQYILGEWEFFGLRMFCGKGCLIPRPETELCVEKVIEILPKGGRFLDLCTGSGCISVAILKERPDVTGTCVDISEDALFYAKKNAQYHKIENRLEFVNMPLESYVPNTAYDCIVSNPPYVKTKDVEEFPEVMKHEPRIAFDGGADGLSFYKIIAERYADSFLKDGGAIVFEAGYDTVSSVRGILEKQGMKTEILSDMFGVERVCIGRK